MRNLESRKGSIIASETISASWSIGKPKDHARRHQPRTFVTLYVSWAPWQRIGPSRAMKLYLDSRPPRPGKVGQDCKKGEIQWTITINPLARRHTDSRRAELQPQRARSSQKRPQKCKRKLPSSAARRWTTSTNPGKARRALWAKQLRNCTQGENKFPAWRTLLRTSLKPPRTIFARRT